MLGHIDALGLIDGRGLTADSTDFAALGTEGALGVVVIDAKAFAPSNYSKWSKGIVDGNVWDLYPYYAWQLSIYSHALGGVPIVMAIGQKHEDDTRVELTNFRLDLFTVAPIAKSEIVKRVVKLEQMAKKGVDGIPAVCDYAAYPCPFYAHGFHSRPNEAAVIEPATVRDMTNLTTLADMRAELYAQMKGLERQISNVDDMIREEVNGQVGNLKMDGSEAVSSLSFYHHKSRAVDWERLGREFGVKKDDYMVEVESPNLSVKVNPRRVKKSVEETGNVAA